MRINKAVLEFQSLGLLVFILLTILIYHFPNFLKDKPLYKSDDLKIDINKADQTTLEKIPYIGEKTASLIIEDRNIRGYYKNIDELKWIRNFDKVKEYIKVEEVNEW